jgi:hypothetical protein
MKLIARVHWLIFCLSLGLATASEPAPQFTPAVADDTMNALFQQRDGWIGADGAYSVALSAERTLWLFGDTWVGRIRDGRRVDSVMVNNSVAIQDGKGNDARVKFFVRRDATSKPTALIAPADGRGWFWPQAGILIGGRLHLFLAQIEKSGGNGVFSFRQIGQSLGIVDNPAEEPTSWHVEHAVHLPFREQRRIRAPRFGPVGHLRQPPEADGKHCSLRDGPLEPFLALEHLEPGLAQRVTEGAERVRVERGRRKRASPGREIACGRCAAELRSQRPELREELLARQEPPREEAGSALGRIPGPEVLDDGLRVNARAGILGELTHRGRPPHPLRGCTQLLEDLLVGVAASETRTKCGEFGFVDAHRGTLG